VLGACRGAQRAAPSVQVLPRADVSGGTSAPTSAPASPASPASDEPSIDKGWIRMHTHPGRVEATSQEAALAATRVAAAQALVELTSVVEECSSAGGHHAFFEPVGAPPRRFTIAHLGGHGIRLPLEDGTLSVETRLYVAGLEVHDAPSRLGNAAAWCLDAAPSFDASIVSLVPVRSQKEGLRLLEPDR